MVGRLAALLLLASCGAPGGACYGGGYADVTSYPFQETSRTASGIALDDPLGQLDSPEVDRQTAAVEACLRARFPGGQLPPDLARRADCLGDRVDLVAHRACLRVQVAPDWRVGCAGQEVFPCAVDPALCAAKGLRPTAECPCECRSAIQGDRTVVVTPDLRLYEGDLLRLQTGCNYVWVPGLEECYGV